VSVVDGKLPVVIHHQISCLQFSNTSNIFRTLLRLDYLKLTQGSHRNLKKGALLINNAACTSRTRQETPEGIEMQFATNVLGYFRLIDEFTAILKASVPARIVNVASYWLAVWILTIWSLPAEAIITTKLTGSPNKPAVC